jgi:hypothetical protein
VGGVVQQVGHELLDVAGPAANRPLHLGQLEQDVAAAALQRGVRPGAGALHHGVEIGDVGRRAGFLGEAQHVRGDVAPPPRFARHAQQRPAQLAPALDVRILRTASLEDRQRPLGVVAHRGQRRAQLVGHAAGQHAQALEPLRPLEPRRQLLALSSHLGQLGHILDAQAAVAGTVGAGRQRRRRNPQPAGLSRRPHGLGVEVVEPSAGRAQLGVPLRTPAGGRRGIAVGRERVGQQLGHGRARQQLDAGQQALGGLVGEAQAQARIGHQHTGRVFAHHLLERDGREIEEVGAVDAVEIKSADQRAGGHREIDRPDLGHQRVEEVGQGHDQRGGQQDVGLLAELRGQAGLSRDGDVEARGRETQPLARQARRPPHPVVLLGGAQADGHELPVPRVGDEGHPGQRRQAERRQDPRPPAPAERHAVRLGEAHRHEEPQTRQGKAAGVEHHERRALGGEVGRQEGQQIAGGPQEGRELGPEQDRPQGSGRPSQVHEDREPRVERDGQAIDRDPETAGNRRGSIHSGHARPRYPDAGPRPRANPRPGTEG